MTVTLTDKQKEILRSHVINYKKWLTTPEGLKDIQEHRDHEKFFKERLRPNRIDKMTEDEFREVYKTMWASNFWGNKDWYIDNKLILPNGFEKIQQVIL